MVYVTCGAMDAERDWYRTKRQQIQRGSIFRGKKNMTLGTRIARVTGYPAASHSATGAGSDAERDHNGRKLAPAYKVVPPLAGAAWPPRMAPAIPQ